MQYILIFCSIAVALGRPEGGYNYNQPESGSQLVAQTSQKLGVPALSSLNLAQPASLGPVVAQQTLQLQTGSQLESQANQNLGVSVPSALNVAEQTLVAQTGSQFTFETNQGYAVTAPAASNVVQAATLSSVEAQQSLVTRAQTVLGQETVATVTAAPSTPAPIVSKYFYLHSAPEDTEDEAEAVKLAVGPARKHYRVVFIKAPSENLKGALQALSQAQHEERTAIYVLTKKTDLVDLTQVTEEAPRAPSKPEVFFIKYKTAEEAALAQQKIQTQYDALGGTSELSDEGLAPVTSVIGSLDQASEAASAKDSSDAEASTLNNSSVASTNGQYLPPSY